MNISKKYIKSLFNEQDIQINKEALNLVETRLKLLAEAYVIVCKKCNIKRVTADRIEWVFSLEDRI